MIISGKIHPSSAVHCSAEIKDKFATVSLTRVSELKRDK